MTGTDGIGIEEVTEEAHRPHASRMLGVIMTNDGPGGGAALKTIYQNQQGSVTKPLDAAGVENTAQTGKTDSLSEPNREEKPEPQTFAEMMAAAKESAEAKQQAALEKGHDPSQDGPGGFGR